MTAHSPKRRCPDCTLFHNGGRCHPLPMWPAKPLVDRFGSVHALQDAMGIGIRGNPPDLISDVQADRWATALGLHPNEVWPGWSDAGLTASDRRFIDGGGWRRAWLYLEERRTTDEQAVS